MKNYNNYNNKLILNYLKRNNRMKNFNNYNIKMIPN